MVRALVLSGRGVPSLSITMVRSRFVKTEEVDSLFGGLVGGLAGSVLAARCAQVGGRKGRGVGLDFAGGGGVAF